MQQNDTDPAGETAPPVDTLGQSPHEPKVRPWEIELLISGAVTFALFQIPGWLGARFHAMEPHLGTTGFMVAFLVYYVASLVLYALIGSFAFHLGVRAYWVGLIGLESVYPRGIRWEETTYGPVSREVYRERMPALQTLIDRADRLASMIFSFSFTVVFSVLLGIVYAAVSGAAAYGASRLFFGGRNTLALFYAFMALVVLPATVWNVVDRRWGAKAVPGSRAHRRMRRVSLGVYYAYGLALYGPVMTLLSGDRRRRWRMNAVFMLVITSLAGVFILGEIARESGRGPLEGYAFVPAEPGRFGVDPAHYESQRRAGEAYEGVPSIQSDVVRDPYVRLFVPYQPIRHTRLLEARCPELRPFRGDSVPPDSAQRAVLQCWTRVQRVTLNGRPLEASFRFYTHPRTRVRGLVAYLPTTALPRGENVITVERPPRRREIEAGRPSSRPPYVIPFWL